MRDFAVGLTSALNSGRFSYRTLVRVDMPGGVVGYCDDNASYLVDGVTFHGKADVFKVRLPASVADGTVQSLEIVVSGLSADFAAQVESEPYHQRPIAVGILIWATATPADNYSYWWFSGFIDQIIRRERPGGESRLIVKCEGHNRELDRASARTRSDADQRLRFASDTFFSFVAQAKNTQMTWGKIVGNVGGSSSGSNSGSGSSNGGLFGG